MKTRLFDLVPPLTVLAVVLFWTLAPAAWTGNAWSIIIASAVTTAFVQGLELLHERHESWRIDRREFATDLFYVVLSSTVIAWAARVFADDPLKAVKASLGFSTAWAMHLPFLAQVALVVFLIEFGQYWMHRLMHNSPLWWTHAPHHHITQLNAMKGAVGNPLELWLISLSVIALMDLSTPAIFCAANILTAISTFAHANVRANPPRWYAFFFTTIRHHSFHHSSVYENTRCNYGNSLILLDRVFDTYREGEAEIVGQDDLRRLSIREQFLFPARPVMDKLRARRDRSPIGTVSA